MKSPIKFLTAALATATLALIAPRPVEAQFTNPYTFSTWNNPISSSADTAIMNRAFQRMLDAQASDSGSAAPAPSAPSAPAPFALLRCKSCPSGWQPIQPSALPSRVNSPPFTATS